MSDTTTTPDLRSNELKARARVSEYLALWKTMHQRSDVIHGIGNPEGGVTTLLDSDLALLACQAPVGYVSFHTNIGPQFNTNLAGIYFDTCIGFYPVYK